MTSPKRKESVVAGDEDHGRSVSQDSVNSRLRRLSSNYLSSSLSNDWEPTGRGDDYEPENHDLQRQRSSSFSLRFRHAGGVNSIDNFARSWQRAAGFPEVVPRLSSFTVTESEDFEANGVGAVLVPKERQSLLGQHLDRGGPLPNMVVDEGEDGSGAIAPSPDRGYGTSYGTISSRVSEMTRRHAIQFHREQLSAVDTDGDSDQEPLLIKQVQYEDGTKESVIVGQSTVPQTIFNSVNVLIGVGLLSLPLGIKHAGWLLGLTFLLFSAVATSYTAKILAKCLDIDQSLVTYADLAYVSFGRQARLVTSFLFCLELIGACVALVVLFADSLDALIPGWSIVQWKVICGIILIPFNFVPLRLLSVTSILGILSCTSIVIIVFIDGFIKQSTPGSLREPARTSLFPDSWATIPLSFGLIMSPWGGHSVFPNIYRDMRHPQKYGNTLWTTYMFTYSLDCAMAIIGWLMFGDSVQDEITANILLTEGYPRGLSICVVIFIAVIPITKVPLNSRPLVATIEVLCGLNSQTGMPHRHPGAVNQTIRQTVKIAIRVLVVVVIVLIAIVFPSFDRIMALMGSCLCFTICIILPLAFYLKIFGNEIPRGERIVDWALLLASSIMAITGTVWAFLPKETILAD